MSDSYYVIKREVSEMRHMRLTLVPVYLEGKSSYYGWIYETEAARRFKSIAEIRRFITSSLTSGKASHGSGDIGAWIFLKITVIPAADVITNVHTMGLLCGGEK